MVSMYFETYSGERHFAFFGAVSKWEDISLAPPSAIYKPYNISKITTMCPVFPDHQKCYFKAFQNKTIILILSFTRL